MDSRAQHTQLITMTPLSAAVLISPPLRAGEKHGLDFEAPLRRRGCTASFSLALRRLVLGNPWDFDSAV